MNECKPIETVYNGYRFRSRLEARWAVFFDNAGIKYEYEPEGYESNGEMYLPDFYLPDADMHVEVKGIRQGYEKEIIRLENFIVWGGPIKQIVILSNIPDTSEPGLPHFPGFFWKGDGVETGWVFFAHGNVPHFSSANYRHPSIREWNLENKWHPFSILPVSDYKLSVNRRNTSKTIDEMTGKTFDEMMRDVNKEVFAAFEKARQARFEHGEKG